MAGSTLLNTRGNATNASLFFIMEYGNPSVVLLCKYGNQSITINSVLLLYSIQQQDLCIFLTFVGCQRDV